MAQVTHWIWHYRIAVTWYWPDRLPRVLAEVQISLVGVKVIVLGFGVDVQI